MQRTEQPTQDQQVEEWLSAFGLDMWSVAQQCARDTLGPGADEDFSKVGPIYERLVQISHRKAHCAEMRYLHRSDADRSWREEFDRALESQDWETLVRAWISASSTGGPAMGHATTAELLALADRLDILWSVTSRATGDHGRVIVFGAALRAKVDNVFAGHIIKPKKSGVSGYTLVPLRSSAPLQSPGRP